jgi:integrase
MHVRVEPEAALLLKAYCGRDRAFKFCQMYASTNNFNAALNKGLKMVGEAVGVEDLGFYYARYSWASIAANTCELSTDTADDGLAHSDRRMARVYIKRDWTRIFKANSAVLDALR